MRPSSVRQRTFVRAVTGCAVTLAGWVALGGCVSSSSRETVRPTEHLSSETEDGDLMAEYDLQAGEEGLGEVKVWSHGAYQADVGGVEKTVIRVGFRIENTSSEPLVFDPDATKLATVEVNDRDLQNLPVANTQGNYVIPPKGAGEIDAYFILPPGIEPQHVDGFELLWTVDSGGQPYTEFTSFVENDVYYGYSYGRPFYGPYPYAYDPFYDPLYYDPWYWHYYRPSYVVPQAPGVVVREHGQVREHRQQVRAAPRQPAPKTVTPRQPGPVPRVTPQQPAPAPRTTPPAHMIQPPPRQPAPAQPLPSM